MFFSRDRKTMKALKWDGDVFLMYTKRLSQGCFREVLRNDDGSVRRLQWDDFYMLVRGITPVKVTVENHFEIAVNSIYIIRNQTINPFKKSCIYQSFFVTLKHKKDELIELLQHQWTSSG